MRILIYDSGIGMLPFYHLVLKKQKKNHYYLEMEDKLFPLGNHSRKELIAYAHERLEAWREAQYDHIFIVCNTFSAVISTMNLDNYPFKIHTILAYNQSLAMNHDAIVIATKATASYFHERGLIALDFSFLVPLIEKGQIEKIIHVLKGYSFPKRTIILGCTHFTHIRFLLEGLFPSHHFIDAYSLLAEEVPNDETYEEHANAKARFYLKKFGFSHNFYS